MHSITYIKFNPLSHPPLSSNFARNKDFSFPYYLLQNRPSNKKKLVVTAKKRDAYDGNVRRRINHGRVVDDDMIVLRMRIRGMKMLEVENDEAPWYWMEWEKKWYDEKYDSDICEAMGKLQRFLMDARPALVVGFLALLFLSVSTSSLFLLTHLLPFLG